MEEAEVQKLLHALQTKDRQKQEGGRSLDGGGECGVGVEMKEGRRRKNLVCQVNAVS